jgi:hypothetical protein
MLVVPGGTSKVGTGSGTLGFSSPFRSSFVGRVGTTIGLLVGVREGTGVLVGVKAGALGLTGGFSDTGSGVPHLEDSGVFVSGRSRVGSFVAVGPDAVSEGSWATVEATKVRVGSNDGESELT